MAQIDIDLTDPKVARKQLAKAIREKKKADKVLQERYDKAKVDARLDAYFVMAQFNYHKRIPWTRYNASDPFVGKPPEERTNEYARYIETNAGMLLFDFPYLEIKWAFRSNRGVNAVVCRDHNMGRDRFYAIGICEGVVAIAEIFNVPHEACDTAPTEVKDNE